MAKSLRDFYEQSKMNLKKEMQKIANKRGQELSLKSLSGLLNDVMLFQDEDIHKLWDLKYINKFIICPKCVESISVDALVFSCPKCKQKYGNLDKQFFGSKTSKYIKNENFDALQKDMGAYLLSKKTKFSSLYEKCSNCDKQIKYIKCPHCSSRIDLFAPYNYQHLRKKYFEKEKKNDLSSIDLSDKDQKKILESALDFFNKNLIK